MSQSKEVVEALVDAGANVTVTDTVGRHYCTLDNPHACDHHAVRC